MFTEAWLHFCDHKKGDGFYHYCQKSQYLHCKGHVVNAPLSCGKNTGLPCLSLAPTLSRWPECIWPGTQAQWVLCGPPTASIPSISTSLRVDWFPDCFSFTAAGFLSVPCSSRLLSSYRQPGADRVKAVILENWVSRGKMCTMFVRARDSEFPVHIIALLRILVLSRHRT